MSGSLLAFNTVERLLKGDFFHWVTVGDVRRQLREQPSSWSVLGLGTTNWLERHGELFVEGTAGAPQFLWADPGGDPPAGLVTLDDAPRLPFVAVAVCDPDGPRHVWALADGDDVHTAIARRCEDANIGLAALRVTGMLAAVQYQVMCHIPIGGTTEEHQAVAKQVREQRHSWNAVGIYAANPTIQSIVSHGVAAVHLHGRTGEPRQGGHLNAATATGTAEVEVWPLSDLVMRIGGLDVAVRDLDAE